MPNRDIFCNSPWYELHIYWDGSLGICCQESRKLYSVDQRQYNIASMTIAEWFNSKPVINFRLAILGDNKTDICKRCYIEESYGANSRRIRSNLKSVIFTRDVFAESYQQSPGATNFEYSANNQGLTLTHPIDLHIDLGNYCNLACKMCNSKASSTIAAQEVKWGVESSRQYLGNDWTYDVAVWNSFKQQLLEIPKLNNIHFMGGETLLTDRFEDLIDTMIEHRRFDLSFSFVTNGTTFNKRLLEKLKKFKKVRIEISIETVDEHNAYQRQGTDTKLVLGNIERYHQQCNESSVSLVLRPAPSILSIGYLTSLLEYALENKYLVQCNLCYSPEFMNAVHLPENVKILYKEKYHLLLDRLSHVVVNETYNASDPNNVPEVIKEIANMCVEILESSQTTDSAKHLEELVRHCERWDKIYGYNAKKLYPEFLEILDKHKYDVPS